MFPVRESFESSDNSDPESGPELDQTLCEKKSKAAKYSKKKGKLCTLDNLIFFQVLMLFIT